MHDTTCSPPKYKNSFCDVEERFIFQTFPLKNALETNFSSLKLTAEEYKRIYKNAVEENLKNDVGQMSLLVSHPYIMAEVLEELGESAVILVNVKNYVVLTEPLREDFRKKYKFPLALYIPDLLDLSEEEIEDIAYAAGKEKFPIYINFLRSLDEAGSLDKIYNKSPAKVLEDFGYLDRDCYVVGCNFLDKDDAEILANYNTKVILTPLQDMMLGQGVVNLRMLFEQGLEVSLGSGCHSCLDVESQAKIAVGNTANLMYDPFPISEEQYKSLIELEW